MNESSSTVSLHEAKGQPAEIPRTKIVEAYGNRKCPKLVEQIFSDDINIRNNTLAVLKDEFTNQETLAGCIKEQIIKILCKLSSSQNSITRYLSIQALESASKSSIGINAILDEQCLPILITGLSDENKSLYNDIYKIICAMTNLSKGVEACVKEKVVVQILIDSFSKQDETNGIEINLQTLFNIVTFHEEGLRQAYKANAVITCLEFIKDDEERNSIRILAMKTLGFMCFDEDSRKQAFNLDAVKIHATFLQNFQKEYSTTYIGANLDFVASTLLVLNGLTTDDEGKRSMYTCLGPQGKAIDSIMSLLEIPHLAVRLNTVKLLSNITVLPATRKILLADLSFMKQLNKLTNDPNSTLAKHATIALDAINWKP